MFTGVTLATVSISTGIAPFTIGNVSNTQPAFASDRVIWESSNGCAYFRMHEAWWGQYVYLNKCATLQVAGRTGIMNGVIGAIANKTPGFYRAPVTLAGLYGGNLTVGLYRWAANNGQSYLRFYKPAPMTVIPYVSCN